MRKINGQPVDAITDISEATGGQALKWDETNTRMVWELQDGEDYIVIKWYGDRGVWCGGYINAGAVAEVNVIDYISISTPGNATDFGDLSAARSSVNSASSISRGFIAGGKE